jgi:hypothetical protein
LHEKTLIMMESDVIRINLFNFLNVVAANVQGFLLC